MTRRTAVVVGLVALILAAGAVVWVWQSSESSPVPSATTPSSSTPAPAPSTDVRAQAQELLDEHLIECTARESTGTTVPEHCGIRIPWGTEFARADSIGFRIEQLPELSLTDDGFVADGGVLVATVTGTGLDGMPRTETYRTTAWSVRGDVAVTSGSVDLSVR